MIIVRQSQLENSTGGDISYRTPQIFEDTITIELTPEEAFFSTEVYRGLYLQNSSIGTVGGDIKDISLINIGGMGRSVGLGRYTIDPDVVRPLVEEARESKVDWIDSTGGRIITRFDSEYDETQLTFYDWLYDRFKRNIPPILPDKYTLLLIDAEYPLKSQFPERQEFENLRSWFSLNMLIPASTKSSMFGQIETEVYIPGDRVLPPLSDFVDSLQFDRKSRTIPYLTEYSYRDVGSYWGFIIKISTDFIPDWNIISDSSLLIIRWVDNFGVEHSKTIKIIVKGRIGQLNDLNTEIMEDMYNKYPPYFKYYKGEEEE